MQARAALSLVLLLLTAAAGGCAARGLSQEAAPSAEAALLTVKVGQWGANLFPLFYKAENGTFVGYEAAIRDRIDALGGLRSELVLLPTLEERLSGLQNGSLDWVISGFTVTPDRSKLVEFVRPGYYSAGAALFAPSGRVEGVSDWKDLRGKKVATFPGYYANNVLTRNYGAQLVFATDPADAGAKVQAGEAVAMVDDSSDLRPAANMQLVAAIQPLLPSPYAVAVRKGNTALRDRISNALYRMAEGGASSDLARFERQYYIDNGAPPNPDLAALLADPRGTSMLAAAGSA